MTCCPRRSSCPFLPSGGGKRENRQDAGGCEAVQIEVRNTLERAVPRLLLVQETPCVIWCQKVGSRTRLSGIPGSRPDLPLPTC